MRVMRWVALSGWALLAFAQLSFSSDRTWIGGSSSNWFDPANWDPPGVPVATESVTVTNLTTIVLTDNVVLASLELRRATLVVSNQLTVTNLVVSDGARLNAWQVRPTPITHPPPGFGIVEVPSGGQMRIVES